VTFVGGPKLQPSTIKTLFAEASMCASHPAGQATSTACGTPGEDVLYVFKPGR